MLTVGIDAHRRLLFVVVVDAHGRELRHWQTRNTAEAWIELLGELEAHRGEAARQWGIEGSGQAGRGLAQLLVQQGERVYEINPRLTAQARRRSRRPDKSDQDDARAIARLVLQEADQLPRVQPDDATTPLAILTRERETLRADLTRTRNRLHAELARVDPAYRARVPKLTTTAGPEAVLAWAETGLDVAERTQLQVAQRRARRLLELMADLAEVSRQIRTLSRPLCAPLTQLFGVGELSAGMLAGYLGPGQRFATEAQFAHYAGVAPLEASSAGRTRHRLNRGGHRKLNELIHRITLTQAARYDPAKAYVARRQAEGKSWREALRALKRYVARAIWRAWNQCLVGTASQAEPVPAA